MALDTRVAARYHKGSSGNLRLCDARRAAVFSQKQQVMAGGEEIVYVIGASPPRSPEP